jgi:SAM-dependent methyltransferase
LSELHAQLNAELNQRCPACQARAVLSETLRTDLLAKFWARTQAHGSATAEQIADFVRSDIGSEAVEIYRCPACGLEFMKPAHTWRAAHYPQEPHSLGWDHAETLRALGEMGPQTVLDVGCATGQFLDQLVEQGHQATGIDFSAEDVAEAQARGREAFVADLSRQNALAEAGRRFSVITMYQVIEHLEQPDLVFEGISQVAAPDALLFVGCPSSKRYTRGFRHPELVGTSDFWDSPPQHVFRWTPEALRKFTARHGWQVERTAFEPLQPYHAAAHLAGLGAYSGRPWARRAATLGYYLRLKTSDLTGIRLFAAARRAV